MPETPESTKGQISDGDTSRLESPKMVKPVLGKVQAKKRLMAFANKFKVLPKSQTKSSSSQHSSGSLKMKDKPVMDDPSVNKTRKKTGNEVQISSYTAHQYRNYYIFFIVSKNCSQLTFLR